MEKQKLGIASGPLLSLLAEMVLDEAITSFRIQDLYTKIDKALEAKDEEAFYRLTSELKQVVPTFKK
nr:IDEAL domain-containing protein [Aneurinibacillus terranovensis]